jgi:hypothetical protein
MKENGPEKENTEEGGSLLDAVLGCVVGLVGGFFLFASTYQPFTGLAGARAWEVPLVDGIVIALVGVAAFTFRKRSAFVQGILASAALLFVMNGLCGISTK